MSYKFMQFGDRTPIDGDRLSVLSNNNKILYNKLNSKPSGILLRTGIRANSTTIPSGYYSPINVPFKVDPYRYVKVKVEVGHLNIASPHTVEWKLLLYNGVSNGTYTTVEINSHISSGIVPPAFELVEQIFPFYMSSDGKCYLKLESQATTSYQIQRYIDITVCDIGEDIT